MSVDLRLRPCRERHRPRFGPRRESAGADQDRRCENRRVRCAAAAPDVALSSQHVAVAEIHRHGFPPKWTGRPLVVRRRSTVHIKARPPASGKPGRERSRAWQHVSPKGDASRRHVCPYTRRGLASGGLGELAVDRQPVLRRPRHAPFRRPSPCLRGSARPAGSAGCAGSPASAAARRRPGRSRRRPASPARCGRAPA